MDNRLSKRRLSDFLSYDWIIMLIVAVALIFVWELIFSVAGVRLTTGQQFKFYYDENMYSSDYTFSGILDSDGRGESVLSYDVISLDTESLTSEYNVLSVRLSVQEGDAIFTDSVKGESGACRAATIVDSCSMYTYDKLLKDSETYLAQFLKEGETDCTDYDKLDEDKIEAHFLSRMKKDNRFRTDAEKAEGILSEKARLKKLCEEVKDFRIIMSVGEEKGLFYRYTKYSQSQETAAEADKSSYDELLAFEAANGRENAVYGLNLEKLTGGEHEVSKSFRRIDKETAEGAVLLIFDFLSYQPDLQFETVSFINAVVREYSDILN